MQTLQGRGRKLLGVFPAQYPREILWALGLSPLEIWDPPLEVASAGAHLQSYICPVVMQGLELVLNGGAAGVDGFLFPHTCDSVQNLASVVHDYLGLSLPCYFFYHPKAPYRASSRAYYRDQLAALAERLGELAGPLDPARLAEAVAAGQMLHALAGRFYELRAAGRLACSNREFYRMLRLAEYLEPGDLFPLWEEFLATHQGEPAGGPAVILSGVLPNPVELLDLLDEPGVRVAHDDLLSMSRRLLAPPAQAADPWETLTATYLALPPCSSKNSPIAERLSWLRGLVQQTGAKAVIFNLVKFCEPELFDVPQLVEGLKKDGLATLVMDGELHQGLSGQMATRVEALVEML